MAIFGLCLPVLFVCAVVSTPVVQGRSLRRHHGHHSHSDYYDSEESVPRILARRLEDELEEYRDTYGQAERREYPRGVLDRSSEYEEYAEERIPSSSRHYKHEYHLRNRDSSRRNEKSRRRDDLEASSMRFVARRKRHGGTMSYHRLTEQEKSLLMNRQRDHQLELLHSAESGELHATFELEVKEAQNSAICNYTVESIPDIRGSRVPRDLEHIKCNHVGSSCQGAGTYCCIQTYRNVEVSYGDGDKETMKIYVGCVCALQVFNGLQVMETQLPIND